MPGGRGSTGRGDEGDDRAMVVWSCGLAEGPGALARGYWEEK